MNRYVAKNSIMADKESFGSNDEVSTSMRLNKAEETGSVSEQKNTYTGKKPFKLGCSTIAYLLLFVYFITVLPKAIISLLSSFDFGSYYFLFLLGAAVFIGILAIVFFGGTSNYVKPEKDDMAHVSNGYTFIKKYKDTIDANTPVRGVRRCQNCKTVIPEKSDCCPVCGKKCR